MVLLRRSACAMLLASSFATGCGDRALESVSEWRIASPSGRLEVTVARLALGGVADYPVAERLYYRVTLDGIEALRWSPLGLRTSDHDFVDGLTYRGQRSRSIDESYGMRTGKRRHRLARANERAMRFANPAGEEIEIVFRAAEDGIAFRYRLLGAGEKTAIGEESGFRVPEGAAAWMLPYDRATPFSPAYEQLFEHVSAGDVNQNFGWGWAALFRVPAQPVYVLLAEADLDGGYVGTHLAQPIETLYRVAYPGEDEGNGVGEPLPRSTLPWTMPWRVAVVGDIGAVFGSTLVDDLSAPAVHGAAGFDWVRPGRSAWSWFSQLTGDAALQRQYVDFAAEMGWEYVLVDAHWDEWSGGDADVQQLLAYAAERGVGILLWYNSGGAHNVIPEPPRDRMTDASTRRAEFARIAALGVKGVKVDFFQSEKQDRIQQYLAILDDAREHRLLVNFHGSTLPRGWQRTYPHLMTMEGVRGAEYYRIFGAADAIHNVRLALTRNVVGSMDYTPVTFEAAWQMRGIPYSHQVALAVLFESGIQHYGERADADPEQGFRKVFASAPFVRDLLRDVPAVWDDSLLLEGSPDSHVVIARRSGTTWYIAGVSGLEENLELDLDTGFLGEGSHSLSMIVTGASPTELTERTGAVNAESGLRLTLAPKEGFVATLKRNA